MVDRLGIFPGKVYMLEIAAIVFIVITAPFWLPLVMSVLSFGFQIVFWLILIAVVIFLLLT